MFGRSRWYKSVVLQHVVVHTTESTSIDGALAAEMKDGIVLKAARLLGENDRHTAMAGEVFIPRERVAFVQLDE